MRNLIALISVVLAGCMGDAMVVAANRPTTIFSATPRTVSARGGTMLTLKGEGFADGQEVEIGGRRVASEFVSTTELHVKSPTLLEGRAALIVAPGTTFPSELVDGIDVVALTLRFVEAPPYSLALTAGALDSARLGDVDGDGDVDLVTCGVRCTLSLNDGRSNFSPPSADAGVDGGAFAALPQGKLLAFEDLDLDGDPDLLLETSDGGAVLFNERGHSFSMSSARMPSAEASVLGDLDGDGVPERVTVVRGQLQVMFNEGPTFAAAPDAGSLPVPPTRFLTLADVDHDSDLDVIVATTAVVDGVALRLFLNLHGTLTEVIGGLPGSPVQPVLALAAGDLDGNGSVDLVAVSAGQDRLLINDGAAHFFDATVAQFPVDNSIGSSVVLVDLDLDRDLDVVIGNVGATTRLYLNDGKGRFGDHTPLLPVGAQTIARVDTADLDGDGDSDLIVLPTAAEDAHLYLSVEPRP